MRNLLKTLHTWVGISAGLVFALLALTGIVLVFEPQVETLLSPELRLDYAGPSSPDKAGRAIESIVTRYGAFKPHVIVFPREEKPFFIVWLASGDALYLRPDNLDLLEQVEPKKTVVGFIRNFHVSFLVRQGNNIVGLIGLAMLAMAASGIVLWLRHRRLFMLRNFVPKQRSGSAFLRSHHTSGIVAVTLLLLTLVTGILLAFEGPAHKLAALVDGPRKEMAKSRPHKSPGRDNLPALPTLPWPVLAQDAVRALPGSEIRLAFLPKAGGKPEAKFGLRLPGEWHPDGRSSVVVNTQTGEAVKIDRSSEAGPASRLLGMIYALHSGSTLPLAYKLLLVLSGLGGLWLTFLGVSSYLLRRRNKRPVY